MSLTQLVNHNIEALSRFERILNQLQDDHYTQVVTPYFSSSMGRHFRHILDHYLCFLNGIDTDAIDYDQRARNERLENDRHYAIDSFQSLIRRFSQFQADNRVVSVSLATDTESGSTRVDSTLARELVFLHGHTIHHFALIAAMLRMMDIDVDDEFGIAPSTLVHERHSQCAP